MLHAIKATSISCVLIFCGALLASSLAMAADTTREISEVPPTGGESTRDAPVLILQFPDTILMHNMSLTSDGNYYYTANGGNASNGMINTYDLAGNPVNSVSCTIDSRAIMCDVSTGDVFIKGYDRNLYSVDPSTGAYSVVFSGIFAYSQSSPSMTPDGAYILEHEDGTIRVLDASTGALVNTMTGFATGGYPSNEAVATDGVRIFTWSGTLTSVYDMSGTFIESWNIPQGHYGFSLGWGNGLLWSSDDGGGGTGMWYGYDVGGGATPVETATWGAIKGVYR
ncbi:MAG: hypothetical protein PVF43_05510 [Candidatus Eiseniibacteriota bacterium]